MKPTNKQLEDITLEAFERSYGSLKIDKRKEPEILRQINMDRIRMVFGHVEDQ